MSILQATSPPQFIFSKYFYTNLYNNNMAIKCATFEKTMFLKTANVLKQKEKTDFLYNGISEILN